MNKHEAIRLLLAHFSPAQAAEIVGALGTTGEGVIPYVNRVAAAPGPHEVFLVLSQHTPADSDNDLPAETREVARFLLMPQVARALAACLMRAADELRAMRGAERGDPLP